VFVLTLQTDFPTSRCFWFSANNSSIEQGRPPWFILCVKKPEPLPGAQGGRNPLGKFFVSPVKTCWTKLKTIGHSSKNFCPYQKTLRTRWWPNLVTCLKEACVKKKYCCQKSAFLEPMLTLNRSGFRGRGDRPP